MVTIPPPATPPAPAPQPAQASVTPVPTTVASLPDKIESLLRQIQVTGTLAEAPDVTTGTITLMTILGKLSVVLPALTEKQQDKMLQQLAAMFQNQKPITVVVQPGTPPTQAFLLLPPAQPTTTPTQPNPTIDPNLILQNLANVPKVPLKPGVTVQAVILPPDIILPPPPPVPGQPITYTPPAAAGPLPPPSLPVQQQPHAAPQQPVTPTPLLFPSQDPVMELSDLFTPTGKQSAPPPTAFPLQNLAPEILNSVLLEELTQRIKSVVEQTITQTQKQILTENLKPQPTPTEKALPPSVSAPLPLPQASTPRSVIETIVKAPTLATLLQPGNAVTLKIEAVVLPPNVPLPTSPPTQSAVTRPLPQNFAQQTYNPVTFNPASAFTPPSPTSSAPQSPPTPFVFTNIADLPPQAANQVIATVVGNGPSGQLILKTNGATVFVKQSVDAPVGSTVLVTVEADQSDTPMPLTNLKQPNFSLLQQVFSVMEQISPQLAQQTLANRIPQPAAQNMSGALLFFLSAIKQGNLRSWLGDDAVDTMTRAGKAELLTKLTNELKNLAQPARDQIVGEWRSYPIPLHNNGHIQVLNFYVHHQGDRQPKNELGRAVNDHMRFVIDMRMSKIGALQLDGFVRPKKLDMIVRSEKNLPEGLNHELRDSYRHVLTAIDYAGSLNFQVGRSNWLVMQTAESKAAITT